MSGRASIGDYVVTSKLGSGSFAVVYKGYHKISKTPVAIKALSLHKLNSKLLSNLEMEISIMRQIDHPNVVKLYDIKKTEKHMYLVLEYCAGGDLQHYMRRRQQQNGGNNLLPESVARHFLRELAKGMQCLWQHNLIHRDLKPQNLLLVEDSATSALKIADFGFARQLAATSMAETLCGSPLYMAPEILKFQKYDAKADLWSVGTILFEMVAGRPPYGGANHVQLLANIERQPLRFPPTLQLSRPCRQLLVALLQRKPALRLGFAEFFADPFVDLQPLPEQVEEAEAARRSSLSTTASIREEDEEDEQGNSGRWGVANSRSGAADAEASSTPRRGSGSDRRSRAFSVSHESSSSSRSASTTPSALLRQSRSGNLEVMETAFASASSGSGALRRSSSSRLARSRRASSSGSGLTGPNTAIRPSNSDAIVTRPKNVGGGHALDSSGEYVLVDELSERPAAGGAAGRQEVSRTGGENSNGLPSVSPQGDLATRALPSAGSNAPAESFSREYGQQLIDIVVLRTQAIAPIADQLWTLSGSGDISESGTENTDEPVAEDWSPQQTEGNSSSASGGKRASVNFSTVFSMSSSLASSIGVSNTLGDDEDGDDDDDDDEKRNAERQHLVARWDHPGQQCKARMARLRAPVRPVASQEELLYAHALRIGRQGAIREVLGQTRAAHDHYLQALLLLESLLMDANGSSVGALAVEDQKSVNNFLRALEQRLKNVRSLLDDESSESSANPPRPPQQLTYLRSATAAVLWTEKKKVTTST
ncbi:hypothetical protein PC115_g14974 [Phytophthora cactorum]|uniref:Protein kinase domain-containing protein n=1 Tax=Phytophthora cactorum TaxID=29920 RepID=A0A8T1BLI7_9STRA|nr:hypothetical protein PC115_g14974 [Phytophthora cactorum]